MPRTTVNEALEAATRPVLLETQPQLDSAEREWLRTPVLGIDTEFVRERTYRAGLGLVQVSDGATAWLWDPLPFRDPDTIRSLLHNPRITKVLHSGSEDLEVFRHSLDATPQPLIDTQIACALLGQPLQLSLQGAVKWLFDIDMEKEHTRSNWLKRPLRAGQLRYAAMDVVLLPLMLEELKSKLEAVGRWSWLEEEVDRMQRNSEVDTDPDAAYLRIKAAGRLEDDALRALRALARWREFTARDRNRARGFVISDAGLLELARIRPSAAAQLNAVEHVHPRALARYREELLQALSRAASDRSPLFRPEPLNAAQRTTLDRMRQRVQQRARALQLDPALLASRKELERLLRSVSAGKGLPERFSGWRGAVIGNELLEIIG